MTPDLLPSYDDALTVAEAAQATKLCKKTIYSLIHQQEIKAVKIGRVYLIPKQYLNIFLYKQLINVENERFMQTT